MSFLPEVIDLVIGVRLEMRLGRSVSSALGAVLDDRPGKFFQGVQNWMVRTDSDQSQEEIFAMLPVLNKTAARKAVVQLLGKGLQGFPIDNALAALEEELLFGAEQAFERHLATLPLKMLVPLTLFILPSVFVLLISPLMFFISQGGS